MQCFSNVPRGFNAVVRCLVCGVLLALIPLSGVAQNRNTVSGFVFDPSGRQVDRIEVELLNELNIFLARTKTDGSGRFFFGGVSAGDLRVKVLPLGTNFLEQSQDFTIVNFIRDGRASGAENVQLEFRLKFDKKKINVGSVSNAVPGVVFIQEIPASAEKLYKKAIQELDDKKEDAGLIGLKKAVEIFPTYFLALDRLGNEYVRKKQYEIAVPYLVEAINVNQKSFTSQYALGVASYHLKQYKQSSEALRNATVINPTSINGHLWCGIALRVEGSYDAAEKSLLQAKTLAKSSPIGEIHWQLALLYNRMKRYKQAAAELEVFLKVQPDSRDSEKINKLIQQMRAQNK